MNQTPLAMLLGGEQRELFLSGAFPHSPFHTKLDLARLPEWARSPLWSDSRSWDTLYTGGVDVTRGGRAQYRVTGAPVSALVEDLKLAVRLDRLDEHLPGAREWLRALEQELGLAKESCSLGAFLNAPGIGLGAHCDPAEVLIVHLQGSKRFRFLPNPPHTHRSVAHACAFPPDARTAVQFADGFPAWSHGLPEHAHEIVLEPGSVLFMPRGCYHETRGGDEGVSVTATIVLKSPSYAELFVGYLRDYLMQSPAWRTPVLSSPLHEIDHAAALASLLQAEAPSFADLEVARMLGQDERELTPQTRWVRDPSVLIDRNEQTGALRLRRALARGTSEEFPLGAAASELVLTIAEQRGPCSWSTLNERLAAWDEQALATVVRFMLAKKLLIRLPTEPYRRQ